MNDCNDVANFVKRLATNWYNYINDDIQTVSLLLIISVSTIIVASTRKPCKIIKSTEDVIRVLDIIEIDLKFSVLIPIVASIMICLMVKFEFIVDRVLKCILLLYSLVTNFNLLNMVWFNHLPLKNYQFSMVETDIPRGILTEIDYSVFKNGKNIEQFLISHDYKIIQPKKIKPETSIIFSIGDILSIIGSIGITLGYYTSSHWVLSNIITIGFIIEQIGVINLKNFKFGFLLLLGLFIYDIYFVFGSDIMTKVATTAELPLKLYLPNSKGFSIIGSGDIIIPGSFIKLCYSYGTNKDKGDNKDNGPTKSNLVYFKLSLLSYIIAIIECWISLTSFKTSQPALLYIVPNVILCTIFTSLIRGEFYNVWDFEISNKYDDTINYNHASEGKDDSKIIEK